MRSKVALKICDYFESLNVGDRPCLKDISDYTGSNSSRVSQDLRFKVLPNADGIIEIVKESLNGGRAVKRFKLIDDPKKIRENIQKDGKRIVPVAGGKRKTKSVGAKVIYFEHGVDFSDDLVIFKKNEKYGVWDKKEQSEVVSPDYSLVDLMGNYDKYAKLSLINLL